MGGGKDFFAGYAVHTFAGSRCPSRLARMRSRTPSAFGRRSTVRRSRPAADRPVTRARSSRSNRLGNPLVNEVIIPTGLKDQWNATQPWQESQYRKYYESPLLAAAMNQLYKLDVPEQGRDDLVAVLLTGVPKLNLTGPKLADVLRLNLSIPVTKSPNRLGVLAGDNPRAGPTGDGSATTSSTSPSRRSPASSRGKKVPLGDGVNADDRKLLSAFPYVADPQSGFENTKGS